MVWLFFGGMLTMFLATQVYKKLPAKRQSKVKEIGNKILIFGVGVFVGYVMGLI